MAEQAIEQPDRDRLDRKSGNEAAATEREEVDRDALHPADYGSRRGTGVEDAEAGEGRKPSVERDRDDDPDGERPAT